MERLINNHLIDIIKTEYEDEQSNINGPGYAGGYTL